MKFGRVFELTSLLLVLGRERFQREIQSSSADNCFFQKGKSAIKLF